MSKEIIKAGAIGDAFGYQVEFKSYEDIVAAYGPQGVTYAEKKHLVASDDTQMTLFLWEAVNKYIESNSSFDRKTFIDYAHENFKNWYTTQTSMRLGSEGIMKEKVLFSRRAPGNTCMFALSSPIPRDRNIKINDSKGCGSVMRTAPLLFIQDYYALSQEELFEVAIDQAAITHGHDEGLAATGFFTIFLSQLRSNKDITAVFENSLVTTRNLLPSEFSDYISTIYQIKEPLTGVDLTRLIGLGWTADEAVGIALHCAIHSSTFKECLERATNHAGDSDSTASLACQLYVARHGLEKSDILVTTDLDYLIEYLCLDYSCAVHMKKANK